MKPLDWQKTLRHDRLHYIGETSTCLFVYGNEVTGKLDTSKPYDMVIPIRFLAPLRDKELDEIIIKNVKRTGKVLIDKGEAKGAVNIKHLKQKLHFALLGCRPEGHLYELTKEERKKIDRLFLEMATLLPKKSAYLATATSFHAFIHEDMKTLDIYDHNVPVEQAVFMGFMGYDSSYIVFPSSPVKARTAADMEGRDLFKLMVLEETNHAVDMQPNYEGIPLDVSVSISQRILSGDVQLLNQWVEVANAFVNPPDLAVMRLKDGFIKLAERAFAGEQMEAYKEYSIKQFGSTDKVYEELLWQVLEEWNAAFNIFSEQQYGDINLGMNSLDLIKREMAERQFKTEIYSKTATIFGNFFNGNNEKEVRKLFEFMFPPVVSRGADGQLETNSTGSNHVMNQAIDLYYDRRYSEAQTSHGVRYVGSISEALREEERKPLNPLQVKTKPIGLCK